MKKKILISIFTLVLFFSVVPQVSAQSCTDSKGTKCGAGEVCCPMPPSGAVTECRTQASCASVNPSYKAPTAGTEKGLFDNPLKSQDLIQLFMNVLRMVVQVAGVILVFAYVWVGFLFAAAQGNSEQLSKARNALLWTAVGTAVILGAEGIALLVGSTVASLAP